MGLDDVEGASLGWMDGACEMLGASVGHWVVQLGAEEVDGDWVGIPDGAVLVLG